MNNTASRIIRSEEITIDMRICTILAGGKKPGEVYFAAIAPDMELTVITLDEVPDILPCFDESDVSDIRCRRSLRQRWEMRSARSKPADTDTRHLTWDRPESS